MFRWLTSLLRPTTRVSPTRPVRRPQLECLEGRETPSVTSAGVSGDTLFVATDNRATDAYVMRNGDTLQVCDFTNFFNRSVPLTGVKCVQFVGGAGNDSFRDEISWMPLHAWGNGGNDTFKGAMTAPNILVGGAGNDTLRGGDGDDLLFGGAGDDTYVAGGGFNTYQKDFAPTAWAKNGYQATDIVQGLAGTCSIAAALAAGVGNVNYPANIRYLGSSTYQIRLWANGAARYQNVFFDGTWDDNDLKPTGVRSANGMQTGRFQGEFWTVLYQRAYLQMYGVNYREHDWKKWGNGWADQGRVLAAITGWSIWLANKTPDNLRTALLNQNCLVALDQGAQFPHAYAIRNVYQSGGRWYVQVYNPWGADAVNDPGITVIRDGVSDGLLTVPWDVFVRHFTYVYRARGR